MSGLVNSVLILNKFLNVKVVEATFNQEKALPNRGFLFDCEPSCGPSQLYNSYKQYTYFDSVLSTNCSQNNISNVWFQVRFI